MSEDKNEHAFDGRGNFKADSSIEILLLRHFERFNISKTEICNTFSIYNAAHLS